VEIIIWRREGNGEGGPMETRNEKKEKEEGTERDFFSVYLEGMTVIRREDDIQDLIHILVLPHTHIYKHRKL
jgi:hypothetical protein